ncbi:hypothetical protein K466DRAFT_563678 [Polyporus arcularius HHB13444]|uniref:Uncharacterized protein n=1 Tax=Polyporus arcularius HHB13444 TaxID=1314778 RepID=A0A5C3PPI3_9APHY|nr:hypothetical protein K466DRAFT_563678 [Polyporus arcularius HHB13444]
MSGTLSSNPRGTREAFPAAASGSSSMSLGEALRRVWDALPQDAKDEFVRRDEEQEADYARKAQDRREGETEPGYELAVPDDFHPVIAAPPASEYESESQGQGLELVSMMDDDGAEGSMWLWHWGPEHFVHDSDSDRRVDGVQEAAAFEMMARELAARHEDPGAARMHAEFAEECRRERVALEAAAQWRRE